MKKILFPILMALVLAACATSAPDRSKRTATTLDALQQNSTKARLQIDSVLASLDALLNAPSDHLRSAYDKYNADVAKMKEYASAIRENDSDLQKNSDAYLKNWQKDASSVSNPELRAIAEQRRDEIATKYRTMSTSYAGAAQSFTSFLRDIDDIRKVIGNDLTPTGQATVKNTTLAQSVKSEGAQVAQSLQTAEQSIADFRAQITPVAK
ncbi:MAG TPA: DUF2959 family protein [Thermoanaerobaculia bacterium]